MRIRITVSECERMRRMIKCDKEGSCEREGEDKGEGEGWLGLLKEG